MKKIKLLIVSIAVIVFIASCKKENSVLQTKSSLNTGSTTNSDLALVPGVGLVPKEQVHIIQKNEALSLQNGHILKIEASSGKILQDFGALIKGGKLNSGAKTGYNFSRMQTNLSSSATEGNLPAGNPNWITYAQWNNPTGQPPITYFATNWIVPSVPTTNHGQTLYLFNGLQTLSGSDILQPVLQWGPSAAGGGPSWAIANWFVSSASGFYAVQLPLIGVTPTTVLQGVVSLQGQQSGTGSYNYTSQFLTYNNQLTLIDGTTVNQSSGVTPLIPLQTSTVETLEAYSANSTQANPQAPQYSTDYPPDLDVRMTNINILPRPNPEQITWNTNVSYFATFGQSTSIVSNHTSGTGEVDIYFHPQPPPATNVINVNDASTFYWKVTVSNGTQTQTATIAPNSSATPFTNITPGAYNFTVIPSAPSNSTAINLTNTAVSALVINGVPYPAATAFSLSNITLGSVSNLALSYSASWASHTFTMASGFSNYACQTGNYGSGFGGIYLLFGASSTFNPGAAVLIGTLSGAIPSATRTLPFIYNNNNWTITINSSGQVYLTLSSAATSGVTGQITTAATFYYPL